MQNVTMTEKEAKKISDRLQDIQRSVQDAIHYEFGSFSARLGDINISYFEPSESDENAPSYTIAISYFGITYADEPVDEYVARVVEAARSAKTSLDEYPYIVRLDNCGNPDYDQDPSRPLNGTFTGNLKVKSLSEAQHICADYIAGFDLGGGNWNGGTVYRSIDMMPVLYIGYNNRVWNKAPWDTGDKPPTVIAAGREGVRTFLSINSDTITEKLCGKAAEGVDIFNGDQWIGFNDPIYDSPLGFDVNIFQNEDGGYSINVYSLKIEDGVREVNTSMNLEDFDLSPEEVARIRSAYTPVAGDSALFPDDNVIQGNTASRVP